MWPDGDYTVNAVGTSNVLTSGTLPAGTLLESFNNVSLEFNPVDGTASASINGLNVLNDMALDPTLVSTILTDSRRFGFHFFNPDASEDRLRLDNFAVTVIPEPGTYALIFGLAAAGLLIWRRRARN